MRTVTWAGFATLLAMLAGGTEQARGAPGDLDPTFGTGGVASIAFPGLPAGTLAGSTLQADGRIMATGNAALSQVDPNIAVARLTSSGSLDMTFSSDGRATLGSGIGFAAAIQDDGKIIIAGVTDFLFLPRVFVARLEEDGDLDASFGGGIVTVDVGAPGPFLFVNAVALQTDGRILVGSTLGVLRLETDGDQDPSFGDNGVVSGFGGYLAIQSDDLIVVGGSSGGDFAVARYETDGDPDPGFGSGGIVTTDFGLGTDTLSAIAIDGSGKIVAAGSAGSGSGADFALARYETDGDPDGTFSGDGKVTTDFGGTSDSLIGLLIRTDGKLIVAGSAGSAFGLARYTDTGSPDASFDGDGRLTRAQFVSAPISATADGDSRMLIGGSSLAGSGWGLGRLLLDDCSNGTLEPNEECDAGALNGAPDSCCTSDCRLRDPGETCRLVASSCDVPEACDGVEAACPTDLFEPDGTSCDDDDSCTNGDECSGGICSGELDPEICIDTHLCYKAKVTKDTLPFQPVSGLETSDSLGSAEIDVKKSASLCPPASLEGAPVLDADTSALAYKAKLSSGSPAHERAIDLTVVDRFGTLHLDTIRPDRLLVPGSQGLGAPQPTPAPGTADGYQCYKVKITSGTAKFPSGVLVSAGDPFEDRTYLVVKPSRLCVPTSIADEPLVHSQAHLLCYVARRAPGESKHTKVEGALHAADRFGGLRLDTVREEELCVPASVSP